MAVTDVDRLRGRPAPDGGLMAADWRTAHRDLVATPCANCALPLEGPFCLACGQSFESFERTVGALTREALEGLLHADGRLMRTATDLLLRPARLTRAYLAGQRASQTPPVRLFLVVVVVVFFVGGLPGFGRHKAFEWFHQDRAGESAPAMTPGADPVSRSVAAWLNPRVAQAVSHQREFGAAVEGRLHTVAILFLPVVTLVLGLLFVGRRIFLFDHAVFAMHSLSFMGLLFTAATLVGLVGPISGLAGPMALAAPVHLFAHLRGVYRTSVAGTVARLALLVALSIIGVVLLLAGAVALELNGMQPGA